MDVTFATKFPWAILPRKLPINSQEASDVADAYSTSFRWARRQRVPELCWPWRTARQLGWVLPSPIDVRMSPIIDFEVHCPEDDIARVMKVTGATEVWKRDDTYIAVKECPWLRMFDFRAGDTWDSMFLPNGQGTVEWRLGLEVEIPSGYCLLLLPFDQGTALRIPVGVLTRKLLAEFNQNVGLSIAIHPTKSIDIHRGDPIAWLMPVPEEVLHLTSNCDG